MIPCQNSTILTNFPDGAAYCGDCIDLIKQVPDFSIDCIIADPPYFLGMTHNGKKGNFRDLSICRPFYRELFREFKRVCKPQACIYFFCDWRSYAFYYPIFDEVLTASNMLVWNKMAGPGNHYAFIHELVIFHAGKGCNIGGTNIIAGINGFSAGAKKTDGEKLHPTQKPVGIISKFIEDSTLPGMVVLDPFGGSGTTAVAAVRSGRRFLIMEQDEEYYNVICKRVGHEYTRNL